jgi:hypothetical protein
MKENDRYRVNRPDVILEDFDDEFVIVNLASGNYYSIDAIGAEIWAMVQQGSTTAEIATGLSKKYDGAEQVIETAVIRFIKEILSENLIVPDTAISAAIPAQEDPGSAARRPFVAPILNKYTDMKELLLLDPIHEVDETGWPNVAEPSSES